MKLIMKNQLKVTKNLTDHAMKTKWGITKCIDMKSFHDSLNGYLIDDTCVFGAEVFVVEHVSKGECLSMIKKTCYMLPSLENQ